MPAGLQLMDAVQDLFDLYQRASPCGPYRLPLFDNTERGNDRIAPELQGDAARIDKLLRGASCLLGNHLASAALPLIAATWRGVQDFEARWLPGFSAPAYYGYLTQELKVPEDDSVEQAYRLYGEVLAIYLDVLAALKLPGTDGLSQAVWKLRRKLAQTGERSSSSGGGVAGPGVP